MPIIFKSLNADNSPAIRVPVAFTAQRGAGFFEPSESRQVTILTDDNGIAQASFRVGNQAMLHTVSINAIGFSSVPLVSVMVQPSGVTSLRIFSGNNQNGTPGESLPSPLVVQAFDVGGNPIPGTVVTYRVTKGEGSFSGQPTATLVTDSSGTAAASLVVGATAGPILVEANFAGMVGQAPVFNLLSLIPQPSSNTTVVGRVIDAVSLAPLKGVYVYLADKPATWDWSDSNGLFRLLTSSGPHVVVVNGFESGLINSKLYPEVSYPINAVRGQENNLGLPALLPPLDVESYIDVSETRGGTLTLRSNPLWSLYVAPGQARFANGGRTGRLYVSFVPPDKIPMPVAGGKISRFFDTVQPPDVVFNPPAQVSFPNLDNVRAGSITDIFTLNYANGAFLKTGRGSVSEDGSIIQSLPGEGLTQGGWHQSPNPVQRALCCIGGILNLGPDVLNPTITSFGLSALGIPISEIEYAFQICNVPADMGPFDAIINAPLRRKPGPPTGGKRPYDKNNPKNPPRNDAQIDSVTLAIKSGAGPLRKSDFITDYLIVLVNTSDKNKKDIEVSFEIDNSTVIALPAGKKVRTGELGLANILAYGVDPGTVRVTARAGDKTSNQVEVKVFPKAKIRDKSRNKSDDALSAFDRAKFMMAVNTGGSNKFFVQTDPGVTLTFENKGTAPNPPVATVLPHPTVGDETEIDVFGGATAGTDRFSVKFAGEEITKLDINVFDPKTPTVSLAFHEIDGAAPACAGCDVSSLMQKVRDIYRPQVNRDFTYSSTGNHPLGSGGALDAAAQQRVVTSINSIANINVYFVNRVLDKGKDVLGITFGIKIAGRSVVAAFIAKQPATQTAKDYGLTVAHELGHGLGYVGPNADGNDTEDYKLMSGSQEGNVITPEQAQLFREKKFQ